MKTFEINVDDKGRIWLCAREVGKEPVRLAKFRDTDAAREFNKTLAEAKQAWHALGAYGP